MKAGMLLPPLSLLLGADKIAAISWMLRLVASSSQDTATILLPGASSVVVACPTLETSCGLRAVDPGVAGV
jgi:hypothetical protein